MYKLYVVCLNRCVAAAATSAGGCVAPLLSSSSALPLINAQEIQLLRRQKIALHNKRSTI